jgi:hypothetical protein
MNTTYQHEVSAAIEELGGDKVLAIIETLYQDGLDLYQEACRSEARDAALVEHHFIGHSEAIEKLRRALLIATDRMPVVIAEESQYYHATAEEFGDEHRYAAAAAMQ